MEFLTILMTGLLTGLSPFGLIFEEVTDAQLSQRLQDAENIEVRMDHLPSHTLLGGNIDRMQIAAEGVELLPGLNFAALEFETDPISIDLKALRSGQVNPGVLSQPLQTGMRFVLTEEALNEFINSPGAIATLAPLINRLLTRPGTPNPPRYQIAQASLDLTGENRFSLNADLSQTNPQTGEKESASLVLDFTLDLVSGSQFQLADLAGMINGRPLPPPALAGFAQGINGRLNLNAMLQGRGLLARFLQLEADEDQLEGAMFIRFTPTGPST